MVVPATRAWRFIIKVSALRLKMRMDVPARKDIFSVIGRGCMPLLVSGGIPIIAKIADKKKRAVHIIEDVSLQLRPGNTIIRHEIVCTNRVDA